MLFLASASPARSRLLKQVCIPFQVMVSDVDEESNSQSDPKLLVQELAQSKAESVLEKLRSNLKDDLKRKVSAVLGCDSVFEFEGEIFGKPFDSSEAIRRWRRMSSKSGVLHTGHALFIRNPLETSEVEPKTFDLKREVVSTQVHFVEMTDSDIHLYVETGEPLGCAGGFALEGIGGLLVCRIEGCYSNVIGISLPWLRKNLPLNYF